MANMANSLIMHKKIRTTTAKAKALRGFVEPLITKSKDDSTRSRRIVFSQLKDKDAVTELFREVSPKIINRPGGYTRILKTGTRLGDNADMCIIELVDYNENLLAQKEETKTKTRRRRRGSGKKGDTAQPDQQVAQEQKAQHSGESKEKKPDESKETSGGHTGAGQTAEISAEQIEEKPGEKAEVKVEEKAEDKSDEKPDEAGIGKKEEEKKKSEEGSGSKNMQEGASENKEDNKDDQQEESEKKE